LRLESTSELHFKKTGRELLANNYFFNPLTARVLGAF